MESTISGLELKLSLAYWQEGTHCCVDCSRLVGAVRYFRGTKCDCTIAKLGIPNDDPSFNRNDLHPTVALVARRMAPFCSSIVTDEKDIECIVFVDVRHIDWFTVQLISMSDDIRSVVDLKEKTVSMRPNKVEKDNTADCAHLNSEWYILAMRYMKTRTKLLKRLK